MGNRDQEAMYRAARDIALMTAMWRDWKGPDLDAQERQRLKAQRWQNRVQHLRVMFGIFEWRYLLLPIGVKHVVHVYAYDREHLQVWAWHLHVFGLRIFRRVTETRVHREAVKLPRVPLQKYRRRR